MNALDIFIPPEGEEPPFENVPYYYPSSKDWMTNMPTLFGVGHVRLKDGPPTLPEAKALFRRNERMFPEALLVQAHAFFQSVWKRKKSESSLYILYDRTTDSFRLWAPEQYVTHVSVNHRLGIVPPPWTVAGTIHSHCDFSAFHSGTDKHDMAHTPGLHITIGHVDRETPEYAIALSLGDSQFDMEYANIIQPTEEEVPFDFPSHWLTFVKAGNAPWSDGVKTTYKPNTTYAKEWQTRTPALIPANTSRSSRMQQVWDDQAWGNEDDYSEFLMSHMPTKQVGSEDALAAAFGAPATDAPSDVFNFWKQELEDFQYDLKIIGEQLADLGFDFDWSIAWNPTTAQQRMFDDATTP